MDAITDFQRQIAKICLEVGKEGGFVLAGGGALREQGVTARKSHDIDLFTIPPMLDLYKSSVASMIEKLSEEGYEISIKQENGFYTAITVSDKLLETDIDFGVDYRKNDPSQLEIGPTLSLYDAVASKVATLFSRNAVRDFYDVYYIRESRIFTDFQLFNMAKDFDLGFDLNYFIRALKNMPPYDPLAEERYGIEEDEHNTIRSAMTTWGKELEERTIGGTLVPKEIRSLLDEMNNAPANTPLPEETPDDRTPPTTTYTSQPDHEL